jgi:hypothetical protein
MGGRPKEIIWLTSGRAFLLHDRVVELFRSAGVSGWSVTPCVLADKSGKAQTDYPY